MMPCFGHSCINCCSLCQIYFIMALPPPWPILHVEALRKWLGVWITQWTPRSHAPQFGGLCYSLPSSQKRTCAKGWFDELVMDNYDRAAGHFPIQIATGNSIRKTAECFQWSNETISRYSFISILYVFYWPTGCPKIFQDRSFCNNLNWIS